MPDDLGRFRSSLIARLQRGEHLVLYGPRGSGKSTLLEDLHAVFDGQGVPCALSAATAGLDDITCALERAYPDVDTAATTRRRARSRLRQAADRREGVLLLDHVTAPSNAMVGFLRRLRGGIAGVLLVMDAESERERQRVHGCYRGMFSLPMPPVSVGRLRRLFRDRCAGDTAARVTLKQENRILSAARGRPGWIVLCTSLIGQRRYWHEDALYVSVLCADTEIALRLDGPRLLPLDEGRA